MTDANYTMASKIDDPEKQRSLNIDEFNFWKEAIEEDDAEAVQEILDNAKHETKDKLLNGYFQFQNDREGAKFVYANPRNLILRRPWCIAGSLGSRKVLKVFFEHGVDIYQQDDKSRNIVHSMVYLAALVPDCSDLLVATYLFLCELLTTEELKEVLHAENEEGLRPLEEASRLAAFGMFRAIFETDGVYRKTEALDSIYMIEKYDVSEYETTRRAVSPMHFLMLLDDRDIAFDATRTVFDSGVIENWINLKYASVKPYILIWICIRLLFVFVFFTYDNMGGWSLTAQTIYETGNQTASCHPVTDTSHSGYLCVSYYLVIHCLVVVLSDLYEVVTLLCHTKKINIYSATTKGLRVLVMNYFFYRIIQFLLMISILIGSMSSLAAIHFDAEPSQDALNVIYIITSFALMWSLLFFLQLAPSIGYFVISVQSMMIDLSKFIIIYLAFSIPYCTTFQRFVNQGKNSDCPEEFSTFFQSMYSTFLTMVNMVDYRRFSVADVGVLSVYHMAYVFMVPILLLNFLVALFSNSISHVQENRKTIEKLQKLTVISHMEARVAKILPTIHLYYIKKLYANEDGRLFVTALKVIQ